MSAIARPLFPAFLCALLMSAGTSAALASEAPVESARPPAQGDVDRGDALLKDRRFQEAVAAYDHALSIDPKNADALTGRGIGRLNLGDIDPAVEDLSKAIDIDPNAVNAFWG